MSTVYYLGFNSSFSCFFLSIMQTTLFLIPKYTKNQLSCTVSYKYQLVLKLISPFFFSIFILLVLFGAFWFFRLLNLPIKKYHLNLNIFIYLMITLTFYYFAPLHCFPRPHCLSLHFIHSHGQKSKRTMQRNFYFCKH